MDAYIASEGGKATLQGCGVSALVPLATAIQRLAENGINITVRQGLFLRSSGGVENGLLVDKAGRAVYFKSGGTNNVFIFFVTNPNELSPVDEKTGTIAALVQEYGLGTQLPQAPSDGTVYNIDGISYTARASSDGFYFTPAPSAWE